MDLYGNHGGPRHMPTRVLSREKNVKAKITTMPANSTWQRYSQLVCKMAAGIGR